MKTGFGSGFPFKMFLKYFYYHGMKDQCYKEPELGPFGLYDTTVGAVNVKLDMTTVFHVYKSMWDKNEEYAVGPLEIMQDEEINFLKTYNFGFIGYNVEKFSEKYKPISEVKEFVCLYVGSKVRAMMTYTPCRSWRNPDECNPGKILNSYILKAGSVYPYINYDERQSLPNYQLYKHEKYFYRNLKDDRAWVPSDLDKLGVIFYLRDCYPEWPAEYKQNWAFIYYLELWVSVVMK